MRKLLIFLPVLLMSVIAYAQLPSIVWQKKIGGSGAEGDKTSISITSDGGYFLAGMITPVL